MRVFFCLFLCVHVCVCTCTHRSNMSVEVSQLWMSFLRHYPLHFLREDPLMARDLPTRLDQLANQSQSLYCLCFSSAGTINACHLTRLFVQFWGEFLQFICLLLRSLHHPSRSSPAESLLLLLLPKLQLPFFRHQCWPSQSPDHHSVVELLFAAGLFPLKGHVLLICLGVILLSDES